MNGDKTKAEFIKTTRLQLLADIAMLDPVIFKGEGKNRYVVRNHCHPRPDSMEYPGLQAD